MIRPLAYEPPASWPTASWSAWRRLGDRPVDRVNLHRVASCLAMYHFLVRELRGHIDPAAVARQLLAGFYRSDHHLHYVTAEAPAFHAIMASYDHTVRPVLLRLGSAIASPSLPGNRTADLRVGQTIVEIKAGWLDGVDGREELYDQLLGYGLLSHLTTRPATHVAAYLARCGVVLRFPFLELFHRCVSRPTDIMKAASTYYKLHEP